MQEREKSRTDELPTRFAVEFFCPMSRSSQESEGSFTDELHTRAGSTRSQGSRWVRQGWSVAEKKRKEKDQGRGSVATRRGCEKEENKKKTKEGKKVAPPKARFRVLSTKKFFFWFTSIWVLRDPSRLKYRLLRDLVYEEAMCEGSSGNGLPYAAKAVP